MGRAVTARRFDAVLRAARRTLLRVAAASLLPTLAAAPLAAQGTGWLPRLRLDNDAYNFWIHPGDRTDEEYTNGVVASLETLGAPWWGKRFGGGNPACADSRDRRGTCLTTAVSLTQDIYTPNLRRPPFSSDTWENERPYAGWLSLGAEGRRVSHRALRTVSLAVGVTGKPSLGQAMQQLAHHINSSWTVEAQGWETQVGFQPGFIAGYRHSLLAARGSAEGQGFFDLVPYAGVSVGNILTNAEVGGRTRIGINLSHPWDPRRWRQRAPWEGWLSAGGRLEHVAYNFSLDGTIPNPGRHVERTPGVAEYEFGAGVRIQRLSLAYRAVTRSREYATGPARFTWSSMTAGVEFFR